MNATANNNAKVIAKGCETPWGPARYAKQLAPGLTEVGTASHGGIHVADRLLPLIPEAARVWAKRWSGSENWYEEDCCWAVVAVIFPQAFEDDNRDTARRILLNYAYDTRDAERRAARDTIARGPAPDCVNCGQPGTERLACIYTPHDPQAVCEECVEKLCATGLWHVESDGYGDNSDDDDDIATDETRSYGPQGR
jgi:hypothetical protein